MRWISSREDGACRLLGTPVVLFVMAILLGALQAGDAIAETVVIDLPLDQAWDPGTRTGRWLNEALADPDVDRSIAPAMTWWWHLDDGERIAGAELLISSERVAAELARLPKLLPLVGNEGSETRSSKVEALWTQDYALSLSPPRVLHGRRFQSLTLTPLRAEASRLYALESASLSLVMESAESQPLTRPLRPDFPITERVLQALGEGLLNPGSLPPIHERAVGGDGFPTEVPSIDGAAVDMVIVTVDSFADLCQIYADYRTEYGVPTLVRTVEWIAERYPYGSDQPEMIRTFVQDAYAKWSIRFIMIVGDVGEVSTRYAYNEVFADPRITPTDMYYACLDGDWNADHDAIWAEAADSSENDLGDEADLLPELAVGRIPASDYAECATMLDKSSNYREAQNTPYHERFLMLAEVLFPADWNGDPGNIIMDAANHCEYLKNSFTGSEHTLVRLYENFPEYPGSEELTVSAAFDSMDNGFGLVLHNGHGARQTMSLGDGAIQAGEIKALANGDNLFMIWMVNCTAAAFDFDCIAETLLDIEGGGAFAVIGATRETFPTVSQSYVEVVLEDFFTNPGMRLGECFQHSMIYHEPNTIENNGYRWAQTTITLLADPSIWVRYASAKPAYVQFPANHAADDGSFTVTVQHVGPVSPWSDAMVTLRKGNEDYQYGLTDAGGQVSFDLKAETPGDYELRMSARDAIPYAGGFTLTLPGNGPMLSVASVTVNDDSDGEIQGNGNGIAERRETVRLELVMENNATAGANNVSAILRSDSEAIALLDSTDAFGDLGAGGSHSGSDGFLLQLFDVADDAILAFELEIQCDEGTYYEDFFLEAAAPLLAIFRSDVDDNGGDGDGHIEPGETADLIVALANHGRGTAQNTMARIEAPDCPGCSGITVLSGDDLLGDLPPLSRDLGPAVFNIRRINSDPPLVNLLLTDVLGHADTLAMLLERPEDPPGAPYPQYGKEPHRLHVNWEPPASEDAAGYVVLRSGNLGGPFLEVSPDWVAHASFEDTGLDAYTSYYYKIQPLSTSGLIGPSSPVSEVKTHPSLLPGWPIELYAETTSSPLVADVDGDAELEVLVAADVVYGFNADGTELSDGDGDPDTFGIVFNEAGGYGGALTGGDLTDSPGLEVVAVGWNTQLVYVLEFHDTPQGAVASLAPGWPQPVAHEVGIWASPSLGDVDGDHDLEIFVTEVGSGAMLMAWHHDGTEVADGDDNPGTHGIFHTDMGYWPRSTAGFAYLDEDGAKEIIVGTGKYHGYLKALYGDGSEVPGFPVPAHDDYDDEQSAILSSPAIGDIDGDGFPEIVYPAENDSLYMLDHDGSHHPGWPIHLVNDNWGLAPSVALADVTGDGLPEIFACGIHSYPIQEVGWIDADGQWLPGWPQQASFSTESSPVVGDIDGDGDFETILGNEFAEVEAWHHDGTPVLGFPLVLGNAVRGTPSLLDVNQDGFMDLILAGWDKMVYIWTFPEIYDRENLPWYTFMHDQLRTGNYATEDWVVPVEEPQLPPAGALELTANWPNPFNPTTNIRFTVGAGDARQVSLSVHDVTGRRIVVLVDELLAPGSYQSGWNGLDQAGRPSGSGIYFARLSVDGRVETRKMTLLR